MHWVDINEAFARFMIFIYASTATIRRREARSQWHVGYEEEVYNLGEATSGRNS